MVHLMFRDCIRSFMRSRWGCLSGSFACTYFCSTARTGPSLTALASEQHPRLRRSCALLRILRTPCFQCDGAWRQRGLIGWPRLRRMAPTLSPDCGDWLDWSWSFSRCQLTCDRLSRNCNFPRARSRRRGLATPPGAAGGADDAATVRYRSQPIDSTFGFSATPGGKRPWRGANNAGSAAASHGLCARHAKHPWGN